ncbi:MAG: amino acid adenylation domain-containing protein [Clostridia bacterium]|nr:amino acid adenylation domain-containing protein [Clostridia bacterium]
MLTNILQYLEGTAARLPDKLAFSDGEQGLTFGELSRLSRAIGSAVCARGMRREPVVILMEKSAMEIAAFFGTVYAGCFYVPMDAEMPMLRMQKILETLQPRLLICSAKTERLARELPFEGEIADCASLAACAENGAALAAVRAAQIDVDPIYVVFTSGSTGMPKGVAACHRSVIDYTESLCEALPFGEDTVFGNQTPLYFDAPLKEIMPTVKYGATTYFIPKKQFMFPFKLAEYLNEYRINTVCWVVSALTMISSFDVLEKCPLRYLHTVAFGSEVFPIRQFNLWRAALPEARFFNLYGPTEATGMSCYYEANRTFEEGESIPVGRPFRNTGLLLIGEDGREVAPGERGEIYLRGTCVTLGYFANPEKTSEAFVQNPLHHAYPETVYRTGDLGYLNEAGELMFVGRRDHQIKHMGHRIELGEIEAAAATDPGVRRACCLYDEAGRKIAIFYTGDQTPGGLGATLKKLLPRYMLPATVRQLETMPLTANGKLDRQTLRAMLNE